ncbi:hypothetical protein SBP18_18385 [Rhodoferax ferrireducens]|uniref:hypothetical protein n=1 Tax=Rhodoferax ferrireducens TaxID=192843 RepID=UPI00298E76C4|nr:hypothetical protein [Rhodoferax ferrireducens]WPC66423.1 hypothetical protein SBP18_18385 [Rhodoferax ferrireducens]
MNTNKDPFTDLAQLGKLNENVLKIFARNQEASEDVKPEGDGTAPRTQSAVIGDEAEPQTTGIPPPPTVGTDTFVERGESS